MSLFTLAWALFCGLAMAEPVDLQGSIADAIRTHVADVSGLSVDSVDVGTVGLRVSHSCVGTPAIRIESLPGEQFRGLTHLRLQLSSSGEECGKYTISTKIDLYHEVVVAAADAAVGAPVELTSRRMKVSALRGALVDPKEGPFVAVQSVRAGQPVTYRRVKRLPAASTGETVSIMVTTRGLTIRAEGRLLGDAYLGDSVHVANLATDAVVQGTLIAPGTVLTGGQR